MPLRLFLIAVSLAVLACLPRPLSATTLMHLDTPALVRGSSGIVIGQVQDQRSYWNEERTAILTDVTVSVSDVLKGDAAGVVTLTQFGGEVGGFRYEIAGSPMFRPGEEVLLFLWRDSRGRTQVNGLGQGKFDISRDGATGERLLQRAAPGLTIRDARTLARSSPGDSSAHVPLRAMLREIHRTLEEDGR